MASLLKHLTDENFAAEIAQGVVLVDFFAAWCGPCRMLTPIIEEVAKHFQNRAAVAKMDIDAEPKSAEEYQVTSVPTMILFKNGKEVERLVGLRDAQSIIEAVEAVL
ncbi:MAG: thioredoxin [Parachlamydiales bacterium]|jgi:thioredoxin 1